MTGGALPLVFPLALTLGDEFKLGYALVGMVLMLAVWFAVWVLKRICMFIESMVRVIFRRQKLEDSLDEEDLVGEALVWLAIFLARKIGRR